MVNTLGLILLHTYFDKCHRFVNYIVYVDCKFGMEIYRKPLGGLKKPLKLCHYLCTLLLNKNTAFKSLLMSVLILDLFKM